MFGQPPQVSFEQPLECPRMESEFSLYLYYNFLMMKLSGTVPEQQMRKTEISWKSFFIFGTETSDEQIYVRLVDINGEINRDRGRVQVSRDNNRWGSICDDSWDERDAEWAYFYYTSQCLCNAGLPTLFQWPEPLTGRRQTWHWSEEKKRLNDSILTEK